MIAFIKKACYPVADLREHRQRNPGIAGQGIEQGRTKDRAGEKGQGIAKSRAGSINSAVAYPRITVPSLTFGRSGQVEMAYRR